MRQVGVIKAAYSGGLTKIPIAGIHWQGVANFTADIYYRMRVMSDFAILLIPLSHTYIYCCVTTIYTNHGSQPNIGG